MIFEAVVECAEYLGCLPKSVSRVLTGERNTIKGYHVIYIEDKFNKDKINEVMEHECNKKSVYIIELDMTFNSVKECAEYLECSQGSVSNILKGKTKICKGYHIIYAKDRDKLAS